MKKDPLSSYVVAINTEEVHKYMRKKNLKQTELAQLLGLTDKQLSLIMTKEKKIPFSIMEEMIKILGAKEEDIIEGDKITVPMEIPVEDWSVIMQVMKYFNKKDMFDFLLNEDKNTLYEKYDKVKDKDIKKIFIESYAKILTAFSNCEFYTTSLPYQAYQEIAQNFNVNDYIMEKGNVIHMIFCIYEDSLEKLGKFEQDFLKQMIKKENVYCYLLKNLLTLPEFFIVDSEKRICLIRKIDSDLQLESFTLTEDYKITLKLYQDYQILKKEAKKLSLVDGHIVEGELVND